MKHLTLADEIVVLALDDDTGEVEAGYQAVANIAVAAGILMELALLGRIDTDLTRLFLIDPRPTEDALLDEVLGEIAAEPQPHPSAWWIDQIALRHEDLVGRILTRLVQSGILHEEERSFLWVFSRFSRILRAGRSCFNDGCSYDGAVVLLESHPCLNVYCR